VKTLEAPSFLEGAQWDICFFCCPYIFETNLIVVYTPKADEFFTYYQKLWVFFRNRKNEKFNQTLGKI
jgi:hypothetical protein